MDTVAGEEEMKRGGSFKRLEARRGIFIYASGLVRVTWGIKMLSTPYVYEIRN